MTHLCILCQKEIFPNSKDLILNYCEECSKLLILKTPKKIKITKEEKRKKRIKKIVKTLNANDEIIYYIYSKGKPRGIIQKQITNYLLDKYPEKIPFPEVIESIIIDEVMKFDKNGKERYLTFTNVFNLFKNLESRNVIKKIEGD